MVIMNDDDYSFAAIFKEGEATDNDIRNWASSKIMKAIRRAYAHDIVLVGILNVRKRKTGNPGKEVKRIFVSFYPAAEFRA